MSQAINSISAFSSGTWKLWIASSENSGGLLIHSSVDECDMGHRISDRLPWLGKTGKDDVQHDHRPAGEHRSRAELTQQTVAERIVV